MASRGRGRGRGGGSKMPFTRDEMNAVGLGGKDAFQQVASPPPLFPPFQNMPPPIESTDYLEYAYLLKQRYQSSNQSCSNLIGQVDNEQKNNFDWRMFPMELRPTLKDNKRTVKVKKEINWQSALDKCDELDVQSKIKKVKTEVTDNKEEEEEVEDEEDIEGDMDDGTDYVNNYFDNGDNYGNDEDDNMDDGPLY